MFEKLKDFFRKKDGVVVEQEKVCKFKKRGFLDYLSKIVGITLGLFVIYNLYNVYNLKDRFVSGEHLAIVKVAGTISPTDAANANWLGVAIKNALEAEDSRAVALIISSGGGAPYESEKLVREINYLKSIHKDKKIYAVVEGLGASAAYHIASAADEILVGETSMIGSIGVILSNYDAIKLQDKLGIYDRTITAGENKDILSYTKPITPFQQKHIETSINLVHQKFINDVKEGRKGRISDAPEIYSGLFWVGKQAVELGVADRIGDINTLKRELNLDKVKNYTKVKGGFGGLFNSSMNQIGQGIAQGVSAELREAQTPSLY